MHKLFDFFNICETLYYHPMAKKNRIKVFGRFFYWQLVKKYYKDGIVKNWFDDRKLLVCPGRTSSTGNYYLGLLEYEEMSFLLHYARETDVFVDCGANIGSYSVLLGKQCNRGYAIEPSTETCKILKRNLKINNLSNVKIVKQGISDEKGHLYFTKGLDSVNHIVDKDMEIENCEKIEVDTLDAICGKDKSLVNILKIDVEGHEEKVLAGGTDMLSSPNLNVIIMEVFGNGKLESLMRGKGFKLYGYNPQKREIVPTTIDRARNNGIFIRDVGLAKKRVKAGNTIHVYGNRL